MNIIELQEYLDKTLAIPWGDYILDGSLWEGEVPGIGRVDGDWCTYFSERGSYANKIIYPSEDLACEAFAQDFRERVEREKSYKGR